MNRSIEGVILELGGMKLAELSERYETLYGEPCFSKHKPFIIKAHRLEAPVAKREPRVAAGSQPTRRTPGARGGSAADRPRGRQKSQ